MMAPRLILRPLGRSLALRWVFSVIAAATLGFGTLLLVAGAEMKYQVGAQAEAVHALASKRLAQQADAAIALVQERLASHFSGLEKSLDSVAANLSTQAAIKSRNDVWLAEEVGRRLVQSGFTGALVLDADLRVIGADRPGAALVFANDTLQMHELRNSLKAMQGGRGAEMTRYRFSGIIDPVLAAILLTQGDENYGFVTSVPVHDDFGDTIGIILAYRIIRMHEPMLADFARITGSKVMMLAGTHVLSATGFRLDEMRLPAPDANGLILIEDMEVVARCRNEPAPLTVCVMEPLSAITRLSQQIMAIGAAQFDKTRATLASIGLVSIVVMLMVLVLLGRRLARPLVEIAESVDRVADGEWKVQVPHARRADEVGRIARALVKMQKSLAERDRMRAEMSRINEINSRRLVMEAAVGRFENSMAVVMKDISDTVRALGATNAVIDEAARRAENEAERIRDTSVATASRTSTVSVTTQALLDAIRDIGSRVRRTSGVVHLSEDHAKQAEVQLGAASVATQQVESSLGALQGLVADLGNLSLRASLEAMEAGEAGARFAPLARSVCEVSARAAASADSLGNTVQQLAAMTDTAGEAVGEMRGVLGDALRETSEIAVALSEQDAATREIVEGLAGSAQVMLALAEAVDRLRSDMSSAQEASSDFVVTARRMAEDAKAIDGSVREFVRNVVS